MSARYFWKRVHPQGLELVGMTSREWRFCARCHCYHDERDPKDRCPPAQPLDALAPVWIGLALLVVLVIVGLFAMLRRFLG